MKKILLATTLLATSAGFAAADVSVSGDARLGIIYNGTDAFFSERARIKFSGSGTTDGGLGFGASFRAADADGAGSGTAGSAFIKGDFGTLTMGDTGNAPDSLVGQVSGIGYGPGSLDGAADVAFLGGVDLTAVDYAYSAGNLSVELGAGQLNSEDGYSSVAVSYNAGSFTVAAGYETDGVDNVVSAKATTTFGSTTVKVKLADDSREADMGYAVSVDQAMGTTTITAFYADNNYDDANMGVGIAMDLGGGASIKGGIGSVGGETVADAGVTMSF